MKANIKVGCSKENLATIRDFVRSKLSELNITGKISDHIVLATDEACANCMIHQHQCNERSSIEVGIYLQGNTLYIEIKDTGKAFPIDQYQPSQLKELIKSRKKGGFGLMLINKLMDEVAVEKKRGYFIYRLGKHVKA